MGLLRHLTPESHPPAECIVNELAATWTLSMLAALQTTTGVTSDLQQATRLARHMVTQCGMSTEFGPVYVSENGRSSSGFGPETQRRVDNEISRILHDSYSRVQALLVSTLPAAMNALCLSHNSDPVCCWPA